MPPIIPRTRKDLRLQDDEHSCPCSSTSRLLKNVLEGSRYATLIQNRNRKRTKDSIERPSGFECYAS